MSEEQEKIVLENENLIYMVLKKYHLYAQREDFYDLGMIGLCKGAKTYDASKNIKVSTYLARCITNEILGHFRKKRIDTVSYDAVIMQDNKKDISFDSFIKDNSIDLEKDLIIKTDFETVNEIINSLPERERNIINHLFNINGHKKMTQVELAAYFNLSQTQISRIKDKVILKIKEQLKYE